jgi:hypothetical protein
MPLRRHNVCTFHDEFIDDPINFKLLIKQQNIESDAIAPALNT